MNRNIWLASYPKSGNTWFRILVANVRAEDGAPVDINSIPQLGGGIASARRPFDTLSLIDSGLLDADEIDCLRPRIYAELAGSLEVDDEAPDSLGAYRLTKAHDAYIMTPDGEPLLAGSRGARGAIVIVRDPRDVAPSLANHNGIGIDAAIDFMNRNDACFCDRPDRQDLQFRQKMSSWSGHVSSWLDQTDIPTHLIRYEDLLADTAGTLREALAFIGHPAEDDTIRRATGHADFAELRRQESERGFAEASRAGSAFFRRGASQGWRNELTPSQVARIEAAHHGMMRRLGYEMSERMEHEYANADAGGTS